MQHTCLRCLIIGLRLRLGLVFIPLASLGCNSGGTVEPPSVESRPPSVGDMKVESKEVELAESSFPDWSLFRPQRFEGTGKVYCFSAPILFRTSTPELIVYPNPDGSAPNDAQRQMLMERFRSFDRAVGVSLQSFPAHLRRLCADYSINVGQLTDRELVDFLEWSNVKLEPEGAIECYTKNLRVTDNFDIVIRFFPDGRIDEVHFDG